MPADDLFQRTALENTTVQQTGPEQRRGHTLARVNPHVDDLVVSLEARQGARVERTLDLIGGGDSG